MDSIPEFIRTEQNGIEYFTIVATGESGMSQSGLARACGIRQQSLFDLIENLSGKAPSKSLKPLQDEGLSPTGKVPSKSLKPLQDEGLSPTGNFKKGNVDVVVYRADFCSAVVGHYAVCL